MKVQNQLLAYAGLLGMTVLVAILLSIRDKLVVYGPWVLDVLLAAIGLALAYLLHKLYVQFRLNHLRLQEKRLELAQRSQSLLDQETRRQLALGQFTLHSHLARTRIYPDPKGYMPVLANDDMQTLPGQMNLLMLPQVNRGTPRQPSQEGANPDVQTLPTAVRYEEIRHLIPAGHGLLGISTTGVETCAFTEFMTMLISGGSNSGKTNTVSLKIAEAIANGRDIRLLVIDWHARKPDSLYHKIRCYEDRFLMPVVTEEEETLPVLKWFYEEFKRRRDAYDPAQDPDILLVIDEVPAIMDAEDKAIAEMLKRVARKCGRETRGFGMYGWFIAQQMIGLAWLRNVVHTVIGHKAMRINEAEVVCNDHRDIARDMENWPTGRVVVYGQNLPGIRVLQMAAFTPRPTVEGSITVAPEPMEALQPKRLPGAFPPALQTQPGKMEEARGEGNGEASGRRYTEDDLTNPLVLKKFLNEAGKMRGSGMSIDAILKSYGLPPGGRNNQNLKALLDGQDEENQFAQG